MEYSLATTPPASTHSGDGGSEAESTDPWCAQYRCECGLQLAIRTSFMVRNMGMRFRCCPKKEGPCPYFRFLPTERRIQGRALELILIIKEKEARAIKEKEKLHLKNVDLMREKEKIADASKRLMQEYLNLRQENVQVKDENGIRGRTLTALEKKMKKVQKRCSRAKRINEFLVLLLIISTLGFIVTLIISKFSG